MMEQISTERTIITKHKVKQEKTLIKRKRATLQDSELPALAKRFKANPNECTEVASPKAGDNALTVGANGSPEFKWTGLLLSSSLSECNSHSAYPTSCSNFDEETFLESSRIRVASNFLFSDEEESDLEKTTVDEEQSITKLKKQSNVLKTQEKEVDKSSSPLGSSSSRDPIPRPSHRSTDTINSASFVSREHTKKWSDDETLKFYKGLELFGTDFSMISRLFVCRTRKMCKNKFRKEEKLNMKEIEIRLFRNRQLRMKKVVQQLNSLRQSLNLSKANGTEERISIIKDARRARFNSFNSIDSYDITVVETIEDQLGGNPLF